MGRCNAQRLDELALSSGELRDYLEIPVLCVEIHTVDLADLVVHTLSAVADLRLDQAHEPQRGLAQPQLGLYTLGQAVMKGAQIQLPRERAGDALDFGEALAAQRHVLGRKARVSG